jgi:hypothetical protein
MRAPFAASLSIEVFGQVIQGIEDFSIHHIDFICGISFESLLSKNAGDVGLSWG